MRVEVSRTARLRIADVLSEEGGRGQKASAEQTDTKEKELPGHFEYTRSLYCDFDGFARLVGSRGVGHFTCARVGRSGSV